MAAPLVMDADDLNRFLREAFPTVEDFRYTVTRAEPDGVEVTLPYRQDQLRPGGTLSGPTLMTLADTVAYVTVVSRIGPEFLTVTSSLTIDFLRKPAPADLVGTGELLKLGRRQAVVAVRVRSAGHDELVAHATATYARPSTPSPGVSG